LIIPDHLTKTYVVQININERNGKLFNNVKLALIHCRTLLWHTWCYDYSWAGEKINRCWG